MTLQDLINQRKGILDSISALEKEAGGNDYTAEQANQATELLDDLKTIDGQIESVQQAANARAQARAAMEAAKQPQPRRSAPSGVGATFDGAVSVGEPGWKADPKLGYQSHADFFTEVIQAGTGMGASERLRYLSTVGSDEQGTHSDPYGGFLIPTGFLPGILSVPEEMDPIASLTTKIPMSSPVVQLNARVDKNHTSSVSGGLRVYRREETGSLTDSRMQFEQIELKAAFLGGLAYATEELLTASPVSFAAILEAGFRAEFASKILQERLNGTGVGQLLGAINGGNGSLISVSRAGSGNSIDGADLVGMRARCWGYNRAVWLANHDCLPNLMEAHVTGTNTDFLVWTSSLREDRPDMIMGRPVYFTEFLPTVASAGSILLADWSQYLEGVYQPIQGASSMHVRFVNHEQAFKFYMQNCGAPWWRSALTPDQSSSTLSPFVTLAAA